MKLSYDLHIHSALSPCANDDMTPNNIVNMSYIKKLDIISVTDHNSMLNTIPVIKLAQKKNIIAIPGIEITTKEEVHILCYFSKIELGLEFGDIIYDSLPNVENNEEVFGRQLILNNEDKVRGKVSKLLLNSTKYTLNEIVKLTKQYKGVCVPAHIDRKTYSIFSVLGFIPPGLDIQTLEISNESNISILKSTCEISNYNFIKNSDAHNLGDINEQSNYIYPNSRKIKQILKVLNSKWGYKL